ncbi:MAG: histone deacetylase [Thermoplasmata archaeon]|nr:MAG: histone deacetylase [Thermoplasmata archaeon]
MTTQIVYSEKFSKHNHWSHPENAERLHVMINEIKKNPLLLKEIEFVEPKPVSEETLLSIHSQEMISKIKEISSRGGGWLDPDTYVCKDSYEIAKLAAGGLLQLSESILSNEADNGFALIRPPGHHATKNRSMGFCLFNNIAIAAGELSKKGKKVLIFDHDVHHGNGTQNIFYSKKNVLYQSIHLYPHYPFTGKTEEIGEKNGKGYTINAPLSHGNGNHAVSQLLEDIFLPIAQQFKPDIILFSAGFDSHHSDTLGGLRLTADFFGELINRFQEIQPKIICTLEGGYNLRWIGKCLISQISKMTNNKIEFEDYAQEKNTAQIIINKLKQELQGYWRL